MVSTSTLKYVPPPLPLDTGYPAYTIAGFSLDQGGSGPGFRDRGLGS